MLGILRELLRISNQIREVRNESELIIYLEREAVNLFNAENCKVHLYQGESKKKGVLYRFVEKSGPEHRNSLLGSDLGHHERIEVNV
jgi:hypothetical protein